MTQDITLPASLDKRMTDQMAKAYAKAVDEFLRALGITEQDRDVVFIEYDNNPTLREVFRGGDLLGTIFYGIEQSSAGGLQFVVRCTPYRHED